MGLHLITRLYHVPVFCSQEDDDDGAAFSDEAQRDEDFGDDDDQFGFRSWTPFPAPVSTLTTSYIHNKNILIYAHCMCATGILKLSSQNSDVSSCKVNNWLWSVVRDPWPRWPAVSIVHLHGSKAFFFLAQTEPFTEELRNH